MADFKLAVALVLKHEGGYQANKADTGNYNSAGYLVGTNYGISAKALEAFQHYPPSREQMQNLQPATAMEIYRRNYWNRMKGDGFTSQPVADIVFDFYVNAGVPALRILQRLVEVDQDGKIGPITLAAVNKADPEKLFEKYKQERKEYYERLASRRPTSKTFLKGWLRRVNSFKYPQ
jgi:lysozyme family protein